MFNSMYYIDDKNQCGKEDFSHYIFLISHNSSVSLIYASSSSFLDKPIAQCSTEGLRLSLAINQPQAPILASEEPDNCRLILLFDGLYYSQKTTSAHVKVAFNLTQHHYSGFQGETWSETEGGKSSEE